jgi:cellulose synthase/poly-beta-1,6-N-acetylglucosamine synthase-like glycosyltransferase
MPVLAQALGEFWILLPVGIIGVWRWSVWLLRRVLGARYRAQEPEPGVSRTSIITPVYNEDPDVLRKALRSWACQSPDEIIAVIDRSDQACIAAFEEFAARDGSARMIITGKPGKRAALADGIEAATGDIVILIDSDTVWAAGVMSALVTPFSDPQVGGVGTRQNVLEPRTVAQRLFDIHLDSRYLEEITFLAASGDALTCLSGRTAAYRRSAVLPLLNDLVGETFWGKHCISGDDKRLTHLVQARGWRVRYQADARVYTPGAPDMRRFLKQRLRWTRNSWRADLRALYDGWVWRKPALAFHLVDRVFQPFATLIAPLFFIVSVYYRNWWVVGVLLSWWAISRTIRIWPHLRRSPRDIQLLPVYVLATFSLAVLKIYALFTMNEQGWITRWDSSRLGVTRRLRLLPAYGATAGVVCLLGLGLLNFHDHYGKSRANRSALIESNAPAAAAPPYYKAARSTPPVIDARTADPASTFTSYWRVRGAAPTFCAALAHVSPLLSSGRRQTEDAPPCMLERFDATVSLDAALRIQREIRQ